MFCEKCGKQIDENNMFCPVCGAPTLTNRINFSYQKKSANEEKGRKAKNTAFDIISFIINTIQFLIFLLFLISLYVVPQATIGSFDKLLCTFCVIVSFPFFDLFIKKIKKNKLFRIIRWVFPVIILIVSYILNGGYQ